MTALLIVRPQPDADVTRTRAEAADWKGEIVVSPIFTIVPVDWTPPATEDHDALMLTSANAVRHGGDALARYRNLPVFAVGTATARAAAAAGFGDVRTGPGDAAALAGMMEHDGVRRPLHLAGRDHHAVALAGAAIARRVVYAAEQVAALPPTAGEHIRNAVTLIHSPRAGAALARLLTDAGLAPEEIMVAAISARAGVGPWGAVAIADRPDDAALLAAAGRLCDKG